jgi:hypothetical protein
MISLEKRIHAFELLGNRIERLLTEDYNTFVNLCATAGNENPWFTQEQIRQSLLGIRKYLVPESLREWLGRYDFNQSGQKTVALVLAGNIPLVGFHDLLSVLITGNKALVKTSSKDNVLMTWIIEELVSINPSFRNVIQTTTDALKGFDAVIATGTDNSSRHFDFYFRKFPHIIRHNRTSCAVLTGTEREEEIRLLGADIFSYFGLGCRNVSKLYVPKGYPMEKLLDHWQEFSDIINHHKYANNYDYQKAILLVNNTPFLDSGFVLLQENEKIVSPIAVLYFEYYSSQEALGIRLNSIITKLQCVVGHSHPATIPFGQAQFPALWDYADGTDTLKFLIGLN